METSSENPKTDKQRAAAHLWMEQTAKVLNDNGITKQVVLEKLTTRGLDTAWTKESFKEDVYKPVFKAVAAKQSTEQANTTDHDVCVQGLQKWAAQELGIVLPPFPSIYSQAEEQHTSYAETHTNYAKSKAGEVS